MRKQRTYPFAIGDHMEDALYRSIEKTTRKLVKPVMQAVPFNTLWDVTQAIGWLYTVKNYYL